MSTRQEDDAIFRLSLEDSGVLTTCDIYSLMQEDGNSSRLHAKSRLSLVELRVESDEVEEVDEADVTTSTVTTPGMHSSGRYMAWHILN